METITVKLKDNLCLSVPVPPNAVAYKRWVKVEGGNSATKRLSVLFALRIKTDECAGDVYDRLKDAKEWTWLSTNGRFGSSYSAEPFASMEYEVGANDVVKPDRDLLTVYSSAAIFAPAATGRTWTTMDDFENYMKGAKPRTAAP